MGLYRESSYYYDEWLEFHRNVVVYICSEDYPPVDLHLIFDIYSSENFFFYILPFKMLHCKYIRRNYDGTLAIHRSSTMIPCRDQLQCSTWKFLIQNGITSSELMAESQFSIFGALRS